MARVFQLSVALAAASLVAGGLSKGVWQVVVGALALAALWWLTQRREAGWRVHVFGPLFLLGSAVGVLWPGLSPALMLAAVLFSLAAWDLDHYLRRVERLEGVDDSPALQKAHLRRLLLVLALGALLGGVALLAPLRLGFGPAVLLALLAVVGLSRLIRERLKEETR